MLLAMLLFGISSCKKDRAIQELNIEEETQDEYLEIVEPEEELELENPLAKYKYDWGAGDQCRMW